MQQSLRYLPLVILVLLLALFALNLRHDPHHLESVLINKPAPTLDLPTLFHAGSLNNSVFQGKISIVNVWATWCYTCQQEHALLMQIAKTPNITLYGIDYKDDPDKARAWLNTFGNPFQLVGLDRGGQTGINWGVYGTPETFLIDKTGIIRYRHAGEMTDSVWQTIFLPKIKKWRAV